MMRAALICAGTMLALLLLWPVVFGGGARADASTVTIAIPAPAVVSLVPGSCRARLERARRACGDPACVSRAADAFDICEITGAWPR